MNENLIPLAVLPDAAVVVGADGVVREANQRAAALLGVSTPKDVEGALLTDLVCGEIPNPWNDEASSPPVRLLYVCGAEEEPDPAQNIGARITATASAWGENDDKRALFILRPARRWSDAPAPTTAALALVPTERQYQAVFEEAKDGIFHFDAHTGAIRDANSALCNLLGYDRDALCRLTLFDIVADEEQGVRDNILKTLASGSHALGERQYRRHDGSLLDVEVHVVSPRRTTDASEASTLFAVVRDIRERKQAEVALLETQARLRTIIDALPVVMFALDENGVFTFSDGQALSLLGLKPGEVVGRSVSEVYRNHPSVLENVHAALAGDKDFWTGDTSGVFWETTVTQVYGADGAFRGLFGVSVDATERRHLQAQVIQSEKLAAIGQLVAGVAHEINNPLAAISGNAQLLEMHPDPQVREDAQAIRRMTGRANRVVRSLLTFARGNDAGVRMVRTLRAMVEETLELAAFTLKKGEVELSTHWAPLHLEPIALVNDNQIQQVILNLLTNAEHALRERSAQERRIVIETRCEDDEAVLAISDNGCGIAPEALGRIFDPFFTTKSIGDGTGLGLSICHGIIEAHGGRLTVESAPGEGATFFLRLPLATLKPGVPAEADSSAVLLAENNGAPTPVAPKSSFAGPVLEKNAAGRDDKSRFSATTAKAVSVR